MGICTPRVAIFKAGGLERNGFFPVEVLLKSVFFQFSCSKILHSKRETFQTSAILIFHPSSHPFKGTFQQHREAKYLRVLPGELRQKATEPENGAALSEGACVQKSLLRISWEVS